MEILQLEKSKSGMEILQLDINWKINQSYLSLRK